MNAIVAPPDQRLRQDNFDLLRFTFAFVVLLVHAHAFSGVDDFAVFSRHLPLLAAVLVLAAAALLWHFIEKPALRSSFHYVATNLGNQLCKF